MKANAVGSFFKKYTMILALVVVAIFFSITTQGKILFPQNINNLISQNGYVFVLAAGMLCCILTGGNQQKVLLAKWMFAEPDIMILDEPTRGIDVGAKAEIQRLMIEMCKDGVSVIFISSELEEVIRCSNRIVIMRDVKKASELKGPFDANTQSRILQIIAEGGDAQ